MYKVSEVSRGWGWLNYTKLTIKETGQVTYQLNSILLSCSNTKGQKRGDKEITIVFFNTISFSFGII